ncbi:cold shock and DUF1294 domain-containing protein [Shewanella mesophila]|uniref:DUF1294 domain-containing protein n=1 Tax=Shewanella mesophila TaxID=2864208 RepID=UPI001C662296|nr:cold shock and DUF1294 domain-containing protein [Shewanella mesophila]QYJ85381.1 cold shock and DUF1294 domain-containing protein [Shewanella mesophila]
MKEKPSTGTLASWHKDKGFGFIQPHDEKAPIFVHISSFGSKMGSPSVGQVVYFTPNKDARGRHCAIIVDNYGTPLARQQRQFVSSKVKQKLNLTLVSGLFITLTGAYLTQQIPIDPLLYYVALSLITFIMFAIDKRAARLQHRRISERSLQLASLLGGWPGALIAKQTLRHKSQKVSFRLGLSLVIVLNSAILIWLTYQGYLSSFSLIDWVS